MAKILIVGCGDMGTRLAQKLISTGHEVQAMRRSVFTLPGAHTLQGDVTEPPTLQFPAGLDYVFIILSPNESTEEAYRRVYLEGTLNVLQRLQGQSLQRVFWISSSSVYDQQDGQWVDENAPALSGSATARILLESEALVLGSAWSVTVVRFAGIYGPGRLRLLRWIEAGRPVSAEPPLWTNRIHIDDCAAVLYFLLTQDLQGKILDSYYIGVDDAPVPQHEVLDWLADEMKLPRLPRENKSKGLSNKRLSNQRIKELGFRFRFPDYKTGYRDIFKQKTFKQETL
jgi:nucleoside-diphosphate-sugar epimerase